MGNFFKKERFGQPQFIAGLLLLTFLAQCAWLVRSNMRAGGVSTTEVFHIQRGLAGWRGEKQEEVASDAGSNAVAHIPPEVTRNAGWDPNRSQLYDLISAAPLLVWPAPLKAESVQRWGWLARAPWVLAGVLLGASLWYVARRLYGNAGGYIALALYCFSPGMIRCSAAWFREPETTAAWAAFGAIFTAIAVSHTLYAPREVVLWNWRRILLLGVALALAIGSQYSLIVLVPLALGFLLYLAPTRQGAAVAIWAAACAIAGFILFAAYFFRVLAFWAGMKHASFLPLTRDAYAMPAAYRQLLDELVQSFPAAVLAVPIAVITFLAWPRTRYFGNIAPLLVAILFCILGLGMPHYRGLGFRLVMLPFLFLFVAGIFADLLETRHRVLIMASTWGLLWSYALWSLIELARVS